MFQTFEASAQRGASAERIKELRGLMARAGVDAYLVPRADEHQGEYVPPAADRLRWLTGFSGSAGLAADLGKALRPGGTLVLSGLLNPEAPGLIAAYGAHGFALAEHRRMAGWSTLTMRKRR